MLTAFCIILLLLGILSFSIISEAKVNLDIYGGSNSIEFFLFGIRVIKIDIEFTVGAPDILKLELKNKDNEIGTISLNEINSDMLNQALPNPFYNMDLVEVDVYAEYGGENAFMTAMLVGTVQKLVGGALVYLLSTQRVKTISYIKPNFEYRAIILRISGIFCITLADIIYGIIFSKKGEKKK